MRKQNIPNQGIAITHFENLIGAQLIVEEAITSMKYLAVVHGL